MPAQICISRHSGCVVVHPDVFDSFSHDSWLHSPDSSIRFLSRQGHRKAYRVGATRAERSPMHVPSTLEPEPQQLGGEPLEGSGFEDERLSSAFEPFDQPAEEGSGQ